MSAASPRKIHTATVAGVLAIVLLGIASGLLQQSSASRDAQGARAPELSEEAYDDYEASRAHPRASFSTSIATAFVLLSLYFAIYELLRAGLRRALETAVGRLTWLDASQPDAATAAAIRRSKWPRVIGKILLIAGLSLLWASHDQRRTAERFAAVEQEAVDPAAAPQKEDDPLPQPSDRQNPFVTGLFIAAILVGAYELAGVFAAATAAAVTGNHLALGTHRWLSTAGWPILVGGSFLVLLMLGKLAYSVLGEPPEWLTIVLVILGLFAAVWGVERFITAIPVPCPECGGKAFQTNGKPIIYECRECRHVLRK